MTKFLCCNNPIISRSAVPHWKAAKVISILFVLGNLCLKVMPAKRNRRSTKEVARFLIRSEWTPQRNEIFMVHWNLIRVRDEIICGFVKPPRHCRNGNIQRRRLCHFARGELQKEWLPEFLALVAYFCKTFGETYQYIIYNIIY